MTSPVFLFLVYITDKARKIIKMNHPELDVCVGKPEKEEQYFQVNYLIGVLTKL